MLLCLFVIVSAIGWCGLFSCVCVDVMLCCCLCLSVVLWSGVVLFCLLFVVLYIDVLC